MDGEGGNSEGCLKWGGGGMGVIKGSFQKHLKQGVGKGKSCSWGGGLKVSPPLTPPPPENFNHTPKKPVNRFLQDDASAGILSLQTSIEIKLCQSPRNGF